MAVDLASEELSLESDSDGVSILRWGLLVRRCCTSLGVAVALLAFKLALVQLVLEFRLAECCSLGAGVSLLVFEEVLLESDSEGVSILRWGLLVRGCCTSLGTIALLAFRLAIVGLVLESGLAGLALEESLSELDSGVPVVGF